MHATAAAVAGECAVASSSGRCHLLVAPPRRLASHSRAHRDLLQRAERGGAARRARSALAVRASAPSHGDAYDNLFRSKVFQSELVVKEFDSIMADLRQLSMMAGRYPEFDIGGKQMWLDKMEESTDRYKVFMKRLELSDDPAAKEFLRYTQAQMMNGGFSMQVMFEGLAQSLGQYRIWLEEERRCSADPEKHQQFLLAFKQSWQGSALGAIDMSKMAQMADPATVMAAQKHPDFYRAIKEISDNPGSATMQRWMDHPEIGPLVASMWRAMQAKRSDDDARSGQQQQQQQQPGSGPAS